MGILVHVGSFNITTAAAGNTVSVSGLPFKPKVIRFDWSGRTESVNAGGSASANRGWGWAIDPAIFSLSAHSNMCQSFFDTDGVGTSATNQSTRVDSCITEADASTVVGYADVQSFDASGFTIEILDAFPTNLRVSYMALGGPDLTNAEIGVHTFTTGASNPFTTQIQNVAGFRPSVAFFHALDVAEGSLPITAGIVRGTFGVSTSPSEQFVYADSARDATGTGTTNRYIRHGECFAVYTNADTIGTRAELQSINSDGVTLNFLNFPSPSVTTQLFFVMIKGGSWKSGSVLTQTNTSTPISATGLPFSPKALTFVSAGTTENAAGTSAAHCLSSIGMATSTSNQLIQEYSSRDGNTNMFVQTFIRFDSIYVNVDVTADAIQGQMRLTSINKDGFSAIMDDADPSQSFVFYVAAGDIDPVFRRVSTSQASNLRR
jgi:hypothetical protein